VGEEDEEAYTTKSQICDPTGRDKKGITRCVSISERKSKEKRLGKTRKDVSGGSTLYEGDRIAAISGLKPRGGRKRRKKKKLET